MFVAKHHDFSRLTFVVFFINDVVHTPLLMSCFTLLSTCRNKQFDDIIDNTILKSLEESFNIDYFLYIVDKTNTSFQSRFEQFKMYNNIFGFLFGIEKLRSLDVDGLILNAH